MGVKARRLVGPGGAGTDCGAGRVEHQVGKGSGHHLEVGGGTDGGADDGAGDDVRPGFGGGAAGPATRTVGTNREHGLVGELAEVAAFGVKALGGVVLAG